jgi:hypothetical protein
MQAAAGGGVHASRCSKRILYGRHKRRGGGEERQQQQQQQATGRGVDRHLDALGTRQGRPCWTAGGEETARGGACVLVTSDPHALLCYYPTAVWATTLSFRPEWAARKEEKKSADAGLEQRRAGGTVTSQVQRDTGGEQACAGMAVCVTTGAEGEGTQGTQRRW